MALVATTQFGPVVAALLQQGYLERLMREGLDSSLAYRRLAGQETFPGRIGESMTRTRKGRLAPKTTPLSPNSAASSSLDNGMPVSTWSTEQYVMTLSEYADTQDLNLMQEQAALADMFIANARNNGVAAAQSLDRICRQKLFSAYLGGNTRVIAVPSNTILLPDGAANPASIVNTASGTVNVDDIRGFTQVIVAGALVSVSATNPLNISQFQGAVKLTGLKVTAAAAYTYEANKSALDVTLTPDAIPGTLTILNSSGSTWTIASAAPFDTLVSDVAPSILRPRAVLNHTLLTAGDVFTMSLVEDGVALLRDNGVPPMDDGMYAVICDNTSMRQLMGDPDFKLLYQGTKVESTPFGRQQVIELLGTKFIPTTEAYIQATPAIGVTGPRIRRPIIAGADCIVQGNFEGMESWLTDRGLGGMDDTVVMIDGVVQIVREPLDRLKQNVAMTWTWIGDYAVPSDLTANSTIIPTASAAQFKRCVVVEHAG